MPTLKKRVGFLDSAEAIDIKQKLKAMVMSDVYNTTSTFAANTVLYPDNQISFVDKHMNYLNAHPALDAKMYLANLRLMTRIK